MSDARKKFRLDGKDYYFDQLSEQGRLKFASLNFVIERESELKNNISLLGRARNSYIASIKKEMLSKKAGLLFEDGN